MRTLIVFGLVLCTLVWSCSVPDLIDTATGTTQTQPEQSVEPKQELEREGVPNFSAIAEALGCVFAPHACNK